MDSSEQMVDADPKGDVSFLIGDPNNAKTLRVSSKVLSLASSVFAALFSPKYSEGVALSASTEVRQIALADDDPEALMLIWHALHHQRTTTHHISFGLLGKAAVICDKYDLAAVLAPWSGVWMQQWKTRGDGQAHWAKMLCLSSIFGSHEVFHFSSEKLISSCILGKRSTTKTKKGGISTVEEVSECLNEILSITSQNVYNIAGIPERLYRKSSNSNMLGGAVDDLWRFKGSVLYRREALKCALQHAIEEITVPLIEDGDNPNELYHFLVALDRVRLWPLSKILRSATLQEILVGLQRFSGCRSATGCACREGYLDDDLEQATNDVEKGLKGLCLKCFGNAKVTWEEGNCSSPMEGSCKG